MDKILFGAAYYDEYMPTDRIDKDVDMMKAANINVVRIAESTWSTLEPQPGTYNFTHIDRALDAMHKAGIEVIVGTPTYAVPTWLVQSHPDVLAETAAGEPRYGARQIMDITNPAYLFHTERIIRKLMEHTAPHPAVIGFQVDNETKYYNTASRGAQRAFIKYLRAEFNNDLDALNHRFGLDYWSNRIDAWEDFPDVRGTINGSLGAEWDKFRRTLVTDFLQWQSDIVREYAREDQWVTQNFDFDWAPGWSYGLQPAVDHFKSAKTVDIAGVDIYHPTQSRLTGKEIAFGGDMTRSIKGGANYIVVETQAQGQPGWLPYPGQLRLQAYSHLASGSNGVMYWHWHSIHNSFETYWKGLLSHDLGENPTYLEAGVFGEEAARHSAELVNLRKTNKVAIMVSNEALTALNWFALETGFINGVFGTSRGYNDVLRWVYDALFELNVEVDFVSPDDCDLGRYEVLVAPVLYSAPHATFARLRQFVHDGGHLITTFRTGIADEYVKVFTDDQPHGLTDVIGASFNQFTLPDSTGLALTEEFSRTQGLVDNLGSQQADLVMELLKPTTAHTLVRYDHDAWGEYAAVTRNTVGDGSALHIGTMTSTELLKALLERELRAAGIWDWAHDLSGRVSVRRGVNQAGQNVTYLLNYASTPVTVSSPVSGTSLLGDESVAAGDPVTIGKWDLAVIVG